ncbi:hypothetical protein [Polaribacter cellanae]|uniref:Bacteriocin n=1 Tax=Polaribacter cellanae TaxID=2818493 RepID=A0A975CR84_9FLAO|nr:hypothetical protein [Polaribacter cellanae]QTE22437.1 hypothetical protein J3359_16790 [Polaribacter cellanae]
MKELTLNELIVINGGNTAPPSVSDNATVQSGYSFGYRIGRAIGNTVRQFRSIFDIF